MKTIEHLKAEAREAFDKELQKYGEAWYLIEEGWTKAHEEAEPKARVEALALLDQLTTKAYRAGIGAAKWKIDDSYSEHPEYSDETLRYHEKQMRALSALQEALPEEQ